jgi:hypothetical protein
VLSDFSISNLTQIRYKTLLFGSRNDSVAKNLGAKYAADFKNASRGDFSVYCIDNRMYHTCRNNEEADLSGIPKLREFCFQIPARAQFVLANNFIGPELPSLIVSVDLWIHAVVDPELQRLSRLVSAESLAMV